MEKIKRMLNIFLAPSETFSALKEESDWIFPLFIVLLVSITISMIIIPVSLPVQVEHIRSNPDISIEQKNVLIQRLEGVFPYITNAIAVVLVLLFTYFFMTGFIMLIRFIFGGKKLDFKHVFSAVAYIGFLNILASAFMALIIYGTGNLNTSLSIALFLPEMGGYVGRLISNISIFGLWQTGLYAILLTVFYKYTKTKAFSIMFGSYFIFVLLFSLVNFSAMA